MCSRCSPAFHFRLDITPTDVLGASSFSLTLGIVTLSGCFLNVWPIHLHFLRLICIWMASWLACFQRCSFVTLSPKYLQDSSQTFVDKCLKLVVRGFCVSPCLWTIQQDTFYIGIEDSELCFAGDDTRMPYCLQQVKNHSCFVDSDFDVFVSSSIHNNCTSKVYEWWSFL